MYDHGLEIHPPTQYALILNTPSSSSPIDLFVSRFRSHIACCVPVQHVCDNTLSVYVWLDALSAHLTSVGYPWVSTSPAGEGDKGEDRKEITTNG